MSLFQFGFLRKKRKEDEREGGRESEDDRGGKEQKVEEISTEKRGTGMKLESKRVRKYQDMWETEFPWLAFDVDKNHMYCKVCRQFPVLADVTSSLYIGTGGFRKTTIQAHAKSKSHHSCSEAHRATENPEAAPMGTLLRNMNSQIQEKLMKLFNSTYFISKENLAWSRPRRNLPERSSV